MTPSSEETSVQKPASEAGFRAAFISTLPVMAGYIFLGIGFGILFRNIGYGPLWTLAASVLIFAGSMQFVLIDLISGGAGVFVTALTTLAVNARHLFYGISMIARYRGQKKKPYLIFALTDETYSLVCTDDAKAKQERYGNYYFFVSLLDQLYWVTGGLIGNILGASLPFNTEGIDFALTAMFVTIFTEQWLSSKDHTAAILGVVLSIVCLLVFGSGQFLIPAMLLIAASLIALRKKEGITNE